MRDDLVILGRKIGLFDGWDESDTIVFVHYKFVPIDELKQVLPPGDLVVNYDSGCFEYYDSDGNATESIDIIDTLKGFKKEV